MDFKISPRIFSENEFYKEQTKKDIYDLDVKVKENTQSEQLEGQDSMGTCNCESCYCNETEGCTDGCCYSACSSC